MPFDLEGGPGFIRDAMVAMDPMRPTGEEKAVIHAGSARRLLRRH